MVTGHSEKSPQLGHKPSTGQTVRRYVQMNKRLQIHCTLVFMCSFVKFQMLDVCSYHTSKISSDYLVVICLSSLINVYCHLVAGLQHCAEQNSCTAIVCVFFQGTDTLYEVKNVTVHHSYIYTKIIIISRYFNK